MNWVAAKSHRLEACKTRLPQGEKVLTEQRLKGGGSRSQRHLIRPLLATPQETFYVEIGNDQSATAPPNKPYADDALCRVLTDPCASALRRLSGCSSSKWRNSRTCSTADGPEAERSASSWLPHRLGRSAVPPVTKVPHKHSRAALDRHPNNGCGTPHDQRDGY